MFEWLKKLAGIKDKNPKTQQPGMITRTCRICGRTFTLPEDVQSWPDCCQECRAKHQPVDMISRKCPRCGKTFTFPSNTKRWPKYCPDCQGKRTV